MSDRLTELEMLQRQTSARHKIGDIIADRYELLSLLGEGGMGSVYRARQIGLDREVAVKMILPEKAESARARGRFLREAKVTAAIKHSGVVQIYDYGEVDGSLFIAMEILNGKTLRSFVDYDLPPLSQQRAVTIASAIAEILDATARSGLVHRDLKPENIMFDTDAQGTERLVLVDFGLAYATQGDETTGRLTRDGVLSGTPDYMSPEQCRGDEVTPAGDVYALGCILHEMLSTFPPFRGESAILLSRHLFVAPRSIRTSYPDLEISGALDDLVLSMLAKKPHDRPTAASVVERLGAIDSNAPMRMSGRGEDQTRTGRAARMISMVPEAPASPMTPATVNGVLHWIGEIRGDVVEALAVVGIQVVTDETRNAAGAPPVDAVFAPGLSAEAVAALTSPEGANAVIATLGSDSIDSISSYLRAGAAEVVPSDYKVITLVSKVERLIRRMQRRRS